MNYGCSNNKGGGVGNTSKTLRNGVCKLTAKGLHVTDLGVSIIRSGLRTSIYSSIHLYNDKHKQSTLYGVGTVKTIQIQPCGV